MEKIPGSVKQAKDSQSEFFEAPALNLGIVTARGYLNSANC